MPFNNTLVSCVIISVIIIVYMYMYVITCYCMCVCVLHIIDAYFPVAQSQMCNKYIHQKQKEGEQRYGNLLFYIIIIHCVFL